MFCSYGLVGSMGYCREYGLVEVNSVRLFRNYGKSVKSCLAPIEAFDFSKSEKGNRQCRFDIQILTKIVRHQLHVLVLLVVPRCALEHGLSCSGVGCYDTLVNLL